ncbi:hypothetical protein [Phaffia rhodozyma]|uniref:BZIP domain-containing protein n=1 Tax=Phaffia rhodozyma TaxID=264483 RepID=A0A0F7SMN9_PHARH|nr:hypothetical protein [Phaffia rhodozyma]
MSSSSSSCSSNWSPGSSRSSLPPGIKSVAMPAVKPEHVDQDIPFSAFQLSLSLSQQPSASHPSHPAHHLSKHPAPPTKAKGSKRPKNSTDSKDDDDDGGLEDDDPDVAVSDGEGIDLTEYSGVPKRKLSLKTRNRLKQRAHRERRALHLSTLESQVSELTDLKAQKDFSDRLVSQLQFELSTNSALLAASESQRVAYEGMIREAERRDREQRTVIRLLEGEINRLRSIMATVFVNTQGTLNTPPDSHSTKTSTAESECDHAAGWSSSDVQLDSHPSASSSVPIPAVSSGWVMKESATQQPQPTTTVPEEGIPSKVFHPGSRVGQESTFLNQMFPNHIPFNPQGSSHLSSHSLYNSAPYHYPYNPYQAQPPFYSQAESYPNVFATGRPSVPTHLFPPHLRPQSEKLAEGQESSNVASAPMTKRNSDGWLPYSPARTSISRASVMSDPTGRSSPNVSSLSPRHTPLVPLPPPSADSVNDKLTVQVTSPTLSDTQSMSKARLTSLPHLQTSFLGAPPPLIPANNADPDRSQTEHASLRSQTNDATSLHIPGPSPISAYGHSISGGLWGGPPTGFPPFTPSGGMSSMYPISAGSGATLGQGLGSGTGTGPWPWSLSGLGLSPKGAEREGEWEFGLMEEKTPMGGLTSSMEHRIKGSPEKTQPPKTDLPDLS